MKKVNTNMCPILEGYGVMGVFLIPVHALVCTAVTAGGSYSASLVAAVIATLERWGGLVFAWRFTTERQPVLRRAVAFSKISFKHR